MELETNPYGPPASPAASAAPKRPLGRVSKVAIGVGLASFLGMAGAGVAFAVDGSGSSSTTTPGGTAPGGASSGGTSAGPGRFGHRPGGMLGLGRVVHGQFTVGGTGQGYKVIDVQHGSVVSVSSTSITVKSGDGFTQTYTVNPSTVVDSEAGGISAVTANDNVELKALQQGSTATAADIRDVTKIGDSRKGFGFGPQGSGSRDSVTPGTPGPDAPPPAA